ncbi:plasmid recombination protein [Parasphingorhabdus sp. NYA22]
MTIKKHYAILRVEKIKTFADLRAVGQHNTRAIPAATVPGAAPPVERLRLTGPFDQRAKSLLKKLEVKFKKNQIIAVEILLSASPEWWAQASNLHKKEWIESTEKFLHEKFGKGLISISYHTDESTPHIQAVALPIYYRAVKKCGAKPIKAESIAKRQLEEANAPKIWRLSYDEILGGEPENLSKLQTRYHSFVAHLGLERGKITLGQGIKHGPLKQYAKELRQKERELEAWQESLAGDQAFLAHEEDKLRDQIYNFRHEERDVDAKLKALIKREEAITAREAELDARETGLANREETLKNRELMCEINEKRVEERSNSIQIQQQDIDRQSQNIQTNIQIIADRENNLRVDVARLENQKERLEIFEQQLIWVSKIPSPKQQKMISGKESLASKADSDSKRIYHKALNAEWSERLKAIVLHFMNDLARKARLKAMIIRVRKTMSALRRKDMVLTERENRLIHEERRIEPLVRKAEDKLAVATKIKEIAEQSVQQSVSHAKSAQKIVENAEIQWRSAKTSLIAVNASIQVSQQVEQDLRIKRENLANELAGLEAKNTLVVEHTKALRVEVASLDSRKMELEAQKRGLLDDRLNLDKDRENHDLQRRLFEKNLHSAVLGEKLIMGAVSGQISLQFKGDDLIVAPRGTDRSFQPQTYSSEELPPWISNVVDRMAALDSAMKKVKMADIQLQASRAKLEALHPELAPKIEEQRKQDPINVQKIQGQMWADEQARGR